MVPQNQRVTLGGIVRRGPGHELGQDVRIAHIHFADRFAPGIPRDVPLSDQPPPGVPPVAVFGRVPGNTVHLHDDINIVRRTDLSHLQEIVDGILFEVVVGRHVNHDGPIGRLSPPNLGSKTDRPRAGGLTDVDAYALRRRAGRRSGHFRWRNGPYGVRPCFEVGERVDSGVRGRRGQLPDVVCSVAVSVYEDGNTPYSRLTGIQGTVAIGVVEDGAREVSRGSSATGGYSVDLQRRLGISEQIRLEVDPPGGSVRPDSTEVLHLGEVVRVAHASDAFVKDGTPEFIGVDMAGPVEYPLAGRVPPISGIHDHPERAVLMDHVRLGDADVPHVEGPGQTALGIHEIRHRVLKIRARVELGVVAVVGMAEVVYEMGPGVQIGQKLAAGPTPVAFVVLDHGPASRDVGVDDRLAGNGGVGLHVQSLAQRDERIVVRMGVLLVPDRLVDEIRRLGGIADRRAAHRQFRDQINIRMPRPVRRLAPSRVSIPVPGSVQTGVVHVRRHGRFDFIPGPRSAVDIHAPDRNHLDVSAEENVRNPPVRVRVLQEVADTVLVVSRLGTGVVRVDVFRRDKRRRHASTILLVDQRLKLVGQGVRGYNNVIVTPRARQPVRRPALRALPSVRLQKLRIEHLLGHRRDFGLQTSVGGVVRLDCLGRQSDVDPRVEQKVPGRVQDDWK